jgi:hypothetical protein
MLPTNELEPDQHDETLNCQGPRANRFNFEMSKGAEPKDRFRRHQVFSETTVRTSLTMKGLFSVAR